MTRLYVWETFGVELKLCSGEWNDILAKVYYSVPKYKNHFD